MQVTEVSNLLILMLFLRLLTADPLPPVKCCLQDSVCLTTQAQAKLKTFVEGDPALGIKKLDKLHMATMKLQKGGLVYELIDAEVGGLNNSVIDEVSIDMALKIMRISCHTTLELESDYNAEGILYSLPFSGKGREKIILKNIQMELIITFDIVKNEHGKDIMDLKTHFHGYDVLDGVSYHFGNMYDGDEKKSEIFHELLNKTWRTVVSNFGKYFTGKLNEEIFEAIKIYMRAHPLEEFAIYKQQ